jgi:cystathionine beta-lyase
MVPALAQTAAAVCERGQSIMICTPVYPPFRHVHRDLGLDLIQVPLRETQDPQGYTLDFEAMEAALRPDTKLLILCNPHNPVARVFSAAEIAQVGAFCLKHGLVLCSDEIHADLLLEPEIYPFTTALKVASELQQQLIVLHAASKTYNIPGMCCCYAVIPDEKLRTRFRAAKSTWVAEISPLGFAATEAAYRHGEPWRSAVRAYLRENRDLLANFLKSHAPHVRMPHMQATYLAWLDLRALGLEHPAAHFEAHGLGLSNGVDFGAPGHLRLNFACTRGMLREALERFGRAVAG